MPINKRSAEEVMIESLIFGNTSRAIENQEKRGQADLVQSDVLPIKCPRAELESLGFVFGDNADDLFVNVQFPAGWKKVATDHSMWSNLVDDRGRKRGAIFYKAAFYDRAAHMHLVNRFCSAIEPVSGYGDGYNPESDDRGIATDCGNTVFTTERTANRSDFELQRVLRREADAWLDERYPDWQNPLAYWD